MIDTIRNAWKIIDLRKKILYTILMIIIFRLGSCIPVPLLDPAAMKEIFTSDNSLFGFIDVISGGAFQNATIFAMSITPYINSSIIMQLLTVAIPALERLQKQGEDGRKKIAQITRYGTVVLAFIQAIGLYFMLKSYNAVTNPGLLTAVVVIFTFTAGTAFLMWLGEQITEFGIGNGISIILFAGIVSRFPHMVSDVYHGVTAWMDPLTQEEFTAMNWSEAQIAAYQKSLLAPWMVAVVILGMLALVVFIVFISNAERRLPVQYAKRVVGRKMYGGQSTHIPMKVNMSGVLPIIFAQSIASLPATICAFVPKWQNGWVMKHIFDTTTWPYIVIYFLLIIFFSYFYSTIQFNPIEVANNLKKNGGFIPGFRAGKPTSEFIQKVLNKITLFGAIYLSVIAITPLIISACSKAEQLTGISLGGTSIIIVVGVALETVRALEAQMLMRNYKGFLN